MIAAEPEIISTRKIHALISDDSDVDVILMVRELRQSGFDITWDWVQTKEDFLAKLNGSIDVILADFRLPQFGALEALRVLHECKLDIPLIVVTGLLGDETASRCIKEGAVDYVLKDRLGRLGPAVAAATEERKFRHEHQRNLEALRDSEERYRALVENSPSGIFINVDGTFVYVNTTMCRILGAGSPEQLLGKSVFNFIHSDFHEVIRRRIAYIRATGEPAPLMDQRYLRVDGSLVEVEITATPVTFKGQPGFQVMVIDATQRNHAEEVARQAQARFRSIFDNAVEGLYQSTPEGRYMTVNPAMARIFGYASPEEMIREVMDIPRQVYLNPEDRAEFQRLLREHGVVAKFENRARRQDGTIIWISQSARMVSATGGEDLHYEGSVEDITERKRAELRLTIFSNLGLQLSSAKTVREAGEIIVDSADKLFGWDCCTFELYSAETNTMHHVLNKDCVEGQRVECAPTSGPVEPTPRFRRVIEHGAQLFLADKPDPEMPGAIPFGDTARRSESIMYVPIRDGSSVIGILSIQSYTPNAYNQEDLNALQALGDHCAGALNRLQSEEAFRESEERFRLIAETIDEVFWMADVQMARMLYVSPSFERVWGVPRKTLFDHPRAFLDAIHPEDLPRVLQTLQRQQHGEPFDHEYRVLRPDNSVRWIWDRGFPIRHSGGLVAHYVGIAQDITDRKRAEMCSAAFSTLGQKLSSAKTAKEAGEIIVDVADQLFGWDSCTLDLYSAAKNRLYHVLCRDLIHGERADCPAAYDNTEPAPLAQRVLGGKGELVLKENTNTMSPGSTPYGDTSRPSASIMLVPVHDGSNVIGLLTIHSYTPKAYTPQDLETFQALADHCAGALDRIQAETERHQLEEQLRQSQKMEAIGQLAGGVAHDFNNLLTVITGHSNLLLLEEQLSPALLDQINEICTAATRASNLTRQLLTFSRKQKIRLESINLNNVINDLSKMLARMIGEDVRLENKFEGDLPFILADVGMIEQILMNLVVNARDAMPQGGKLFISTETVTIDSAYANSHPESRPGNFVSLNVRDTGLGISPEILPRIFEPFFTTKEQGKGTGLGLATVYGITKQHQGWIEVASRIDDGTTFKLFFPVAPQQSAPLRAASAAKKSSRGNETILLVEDDAGVRSLARRVLGELGYTVIEAESGVAALKVWETQAANIDLLLTDLVMPDGMTGRDLGQRLKEQKPALKIIYSSGYSHGIAGPGFELREGKNFLPKPYDPRALAEMVRNCLDRIP